MKKVSKIYEMSLYELNQMAKWVAAILPVKVRYGKDFFNRAAWLEKSQWWSRERLIEYQNERLRRLIIHAYNNVPYYHSLFKEKGIRPSDIHTLHDLPKIPLLTKEVLRKKLRDLVASNVSKKDLIYLTTSGTTGQPVGFYREKKSEYSDGDPFWWRRYQWGGCGLVSRRAALTSWTIQPKRNGTRRIFSYNPFRRLLILSTYDLSRKNIAQYAHALRKYKPEFISGFPSALEVMVKYFAEAGIPRPVNPKNIFTQSEEIYPWQRKRIREYFGCEIYDWYGMEERVVCASECEEHSGHHIFAEHSIVEFIKDGKWVSGEEGEIIATDLENYGMPMIRYQTGDLGQAVLEKCRCGRGLPLMKLIGGRERSFAVTKEGGYIPVSIVDIPKATEHVEQFQFVQKERGTLILKVVRKEGFCDEDVDLIRKNLQEKFGEMIAVRLEFVEHIARTRRGKMPLLVQHLRIDEDLV
jgi:phenylacetate-CoA ligase